MKMDSTAPASSKFLFLFLLSCISIVCSSSGSLISDLKDIMQKQKPQPKLENSKKAAYTSPISAAHRRDLYMTTSTENHDFMINPPPDPALTTTTPVTNPVTTPSTTTAPPDPSTPMIAIPTATYPPIPPATDPVTGGQPPVTNPANPAGGIVVPPAPVVGNAPAVAGQSWCVARGGVAESSLQVALDYACGIGGADCSTIQQPGQTCYNPNTLQNHASFAFNSYYQKNPASSTSCDFGGAAMLTNVNPSSGSCIFPTGTGSATMSSPNPTTPATDSSYGGPPNPIGSGTPPTVLNSSNPALGGGIAGYGDTPPTASVSSAPVTTRATFIVVALSVVTARSFLSACF